jgi:hypothetical protein
MQVVSEIGDHILCTSFMGCNKEKISFKTCLRSLGFFTVTTLDMNVRKNNLPCRHHYQRF